VAPKTALLTGCSTGIGRATAIELSKQGYEVIATARRPETLSGLGVSRTLPLDVDSDDSVAAIIKDVGVVDVLVNNAGFGVEGAIETVPLNEVRRAFETNFFGAARMIQAVLPGMRERGSGTIVNVTSVAGVAAGPLSGYYSATKFALEALSESLHLEVGHFGIRVIVIEPGAIETSFGANGVDHRDEPGPYQPLAEIWRKGMERLGNGEGAPGPELVATAIADALASPTPRFRIPVGADAELVVSTRESMGYDQFEATMRQALQVDW
jgi:NAD(P)-dependent dehydrogenase (short-subunit alcohol dehydrogenase family)